MLLGMLQGLVRFADAIQRGIRIRERASFWPSARRTDSSPASPVIWFAMIRTATRHREHPDEHAGL